jgi:hypothetical protein
VDTNILVFRSVTLSGSTIIFCLESRVGFAVFRCADRQSWISECTEAALPCHSLLNAALISLYLFFCRDFFAVISLSLLIHSLVCYNMLLVATRVATQQSCHCHSHRETDLRRTVVNLRCCGNHLIRDDTFWPGDRVGWWGKTAHTFTTARVDKTTQSPACAYRFISSLSVIFW